MPWGTRQLRTPCRRCQVAPPRAPRPMSSQLASVVPGGGRVVLTVANTRDQNEAHFFPKGNRHWK